MVLLLRIIPLAEKKIEKPSKNIVKDCTINSHVNKTSLNYTVEVFSKVSSEIHTSYLKYTKNNALLHY